MHPELENLIKAYEAFQVASRDDLPEFRDRYRSLLDETALLRNLNKQLLERAVIRQHRRWLRSQDRPATIPRKA
jgi:hypothetical protein